MSRLLVLSALLFAACAAEAPVEEPAPVEPAAEEAPAEAAPAEAPAVQADEGCTIVDLGENTTGAYEITDGGDDHVRHTFEIPEGTHTLKASVKMDKDWPIKLDIGLGQCPHHGKSMAAAVGQSRVEVAVSAPELEGGGETLDTSDRWFVHIGLTGEQAPAVGDVNAYEFTVQACQAPVES